MAVKRFIDVYPNKVYLWDKEKNNCSIEDVPANSNSCMYWWRCSKGHSFRNTPARVGKSVDEGCRECQGRTKTNFDGRSIQDVYPEIKDIWDYDKNTFFPDELPADNTYKKVWIRCYEGHSFQVTPYEISYLDVSCPVCDKESITNPAFKGIYSKLKVVWDEEENGFPLLMFKSPIKEKFFFVCEHNHKYYKSFRYVRDRLLDGKNPCPYCSGTSVKSGFNDLLTKRPDIAKYYDTDKNSVNVSNLYYKNSDNRYFICKKGHSFISTIHKVDRAMIKSNGRLVGCPYCSGALLKEGYNDFESQHPELMYLWDWEQNDILPSEISYKDNSIPVWFKCSKGHSYKTFIDSLVRSSYESCPYCSHLVSNGSLEVKYFLEGLGLDCIQEYVLPSGKRLDIYIPERGVGIEYNGVYWHTEDKVGKNYHLEKYTECLRNKIDLYFVWEDDWINKKDIVKSMLLRKLNMCKDIKVNARDCIIESVDTNIAKSFLDKNHIQGYVSGSNYIGLLHKDVLVALMVIKKDFNDYNIVRYATSCNVRGGFSKILNYIENNFDYDVIYTFSDNGVSRENLYSLSGFSIASDVPPTYSYLVAGRRVHKFNYRKARFIKDKDLKYIEGLSERELADLNGLKRIYDAGKIKWVKKKPV